MIDDPAQLKKLILGKTSIGSEKLDELIEEKKEKYSGLLTDVGALYMIAKELRLEIDLMEQSNLIKIKDLKNGMENIDVLCRALHIGQLKQFEKNNKKGFLCNLLVGDETGETRLSLWHKDAKMIQEKKIERNAVLLLKNAFVSEFRDKLQLSLGYNGRLFVKEDNEWLPKQELLRKLNELVDGLNEVDVIGRIKRIFEEKTFEREKGTGSLKSFILFDDTASIRCVAWNELADALNELKENDLIKIEGAYCKKGLKDVELHLGWKARIIKDPLTKISIPLVSGRKEVEDIMLVDAVDGMAFKKAKAFIVSVDERLFAFQACPKCNKKVVQEEKGFLCGKCGPQVIEPLNKIILALDLDDGSRRMKAKAFGLQAEKLAGLSKEEINESIKADSLNELLPKIMEMLIGKELFFEGNFKKNAFNEELELIIQNTSKPDDKSIALKLIQELEATGG